jgi:predicted MFS family arabinose efflux permease
LNEERIVLEDGATGALGHQFWLLSLAVALMGIGFQGMVQLLKVLYELRLGFDAGFVGTLFAIGAASFALASVPAGALGSRLGARAVMLLGATLTTVGAIVLASTQLLPAPLRALGPFVFELTGATGWSFLVVNQVAALTMVTSPISRKHAFGLKEALMGIGLFVGALVGGMLPGFFALSLGVTTAEAAPYGLAILTAGILSASAFIPLILLHPTPRVQRISASVPSLPPLGPLLLVGMCAFLNNAAFASVRVFSPAYLDTVFSLPTSLIGAVASVGTLLAIGAALSSARVARGRGSIFAMLIATTITGISVLVMAVFPHWSIVALGLIGALGMASLWMPSYQIVQMDMAAAEWRSVVAGAGSLAMSLGFGTMSLAGGYIAVAFGYRTLYALAALLAFASALLIVVFSARITHSMRAE